MNHYLRFVKKTDCEEILKIYAHYVENTAISFECYVPSIYEFSSRISSICSEFPFLVYQIDEKIVGYAYASKHRERAAYVYDADISIYVLSEYHGSGVAYKLYDCLFEILKKLGYYNVYAAYTVPNEKSEKFHKKFDFKVIGTHHKTGYKLGLWHDVVWLEKNIKKHDKNPKKVKSIKDLSNEYLENLFELYNKR